MGERELERVEQHTWSFVARQLRQVFRLAWTIGGIARNWKSEMLEVNADLMCSPCEELRLDERGLVEAFDDAITGVRRAAVALISHGHALAVRGVSCDGCADVSFITWEFAAENGEIKFFHGAPSELRGERGVCRIIFRHDQTAAGFLV